MNDKASEVKDRVCGMKLRPEQVKESLGYNGRTYFFCSIGCRAEFERHPQDYAGAEAGAPPHV